MNYNNIPERESHQEGNTPAAHLEMLINKVFDQYSDDVWHDAEHREGAQARLLVLESCDEAGKHTKVVAVKESIDEQLAYVVRTIIVQQLALAGNHHERREYTIIDSAYNAHHDNDALLVVYPDEEAYTQARIAYEAQVSSDDAHTAAQKALRVKYEQLQIRRLAKPADIYALDNELAATTLQPLGK